MSSTAKIINVMEDQNWSRDVVEQKLEGARSNALFSLQSSILDTALSDQASNEKLTVILSAVKSALELDAVAFLSTLNDGEVAFACTDSGLTQDSAFEIINSFDPSTTSGDVDLTKVFASATFEYQHVWFQFVSADDTERLESGVVIGLLKKTRRPNQLDLAALGAVTPSFRLLLDTINSDHQLDIANDRFHSLSNSLPGVVYQRVVKLDGEIKYTYISESAIDIFGVSAEEILTNPKALFDSYAPEYREQFRQKLLEASRTLTKWDVEASIIMPNGTVRYTHAIASPIKQKDGSVLWTGVILDAGRIKKAEQDAAESEELTRRNIIESLSQGLVMFDGNDQLMLCNSVFSSIFDKRKINTDGALSYSDFVRQEMTAAYPKLANAKRLQSMQEERILLHKSGSPYHAEYQLGDEKWLQVNEHRTSGGDKVIVYTDVSAIKMREAKIQHMALHDALTELPNRVLFRDRSQQAIHDAHRYNTITAILALDLDNFKNVNDTLGHPAGDQLLRIVSGRVSKIIRDTDTLARLGGDEFAVVLHDVEAAEDIEGVAERIVEKISEPVDLDGSQVVVGVSIGIAVVTSDTVNQDDLIKNADLALYRAKAEGKNTFRFFERSMDEFTRARRRLEGDLRVALNEGNLQLHFQPQVNVSRNEISGFEALVRWTHPELGPVSPQDFITVAEETGLINQLGDWVLFNACKCAAKWSKPSKIAINLSPAQFNRRNLVEYVEEVLEETGLDPKRLELEVTEGLLLHNTSETLDILFRLKGLGIKIAMDDFGTGYSSLGNLRSFPFDRIKIDKSFVMNLEEDPEADAIIKAVVGLGKSLGMETTAEGVETYEQLKHLQSEGCTDIQGFYYSQARPNEEVDSLLDGTLEGIGSLGLKHLHYN